jgi:hypothetical protein
MKRKDFLKRIGLLLPAALVAPVVVAEVIKNDAVSEGVPKTGLLISKGNKPYLSTTYRSKDVLDWRPINLSDKFIRKLFKINGDKTVPEFLKNIH